MGVPWVGSVTYDKYHYFLGWISWCVVQESIERSIHTAMGAAIQDHVQAGVSHEWAPDSAPSTATSQYLESLFIFLDVRTFPMLSLT